MSQLSRAARLRALKAASSDLSGDVGGIVAAAEHIGKCKSVVGRNVCRNDEGCYFNLADAAELERIASQPFVTKAMAKLAGGVFIELPTAEVDGADLRERTLAVAEELGDVSAKVREALGDDVLKEHEAEGIEREIDELIQRAVEMRAAVRSMVAKPAKLRPAA